jgi:hypothetical protein
MNTPLRQLLLLSTALAAGHSALAATPDPALETEPALQSASSEVQGVAHWVADSRDNGGLPYVVIDKVNAQVFVFSAAGKLLGTAPALLGMARGDRLLAPNSATLAQIRPSQRITPAGRYVSRLSIDSEGKELLVLDYAAAISLHPVIKGTPEERRAERLGSPTAQDNRISYGCINVPKDFYSRLVSATFKHTQGVVYVLPEAGSASTVFGMQPASTVAAGGAHAAR